MTLKCDMTHDCKNAVTHIDDKGWVYCTEHGIERRAWRRARKMRAWEIKRLENGQTISYTPTRKPAE